MALRNIILLTSRPNISALNRSYSLHSTNAAGSYASRWNLGSRDSLLNPGQIRQSLHTSAVTMKREDKRQMLASMPKPDEGTPGEKSYEVSLDSDGRDIFPDENTPDRLFNGVRFAEIPICYIKSTPNNTILTLSEPSGSILLTRSCGMEGFKNTRKGTNVAAQATAINFALKAAERGFASVRVMVQGLGPGRMSSIKGLTMGGVNVVSITDATPVPWVPNPRPRKQRKL